MKNKIVLLAAVLTLLCSANSYAAALGFAWITPTGGNTVIPVTGTNQPLTIKGSANVVFGYSHNDGGTTYSLGTYHTTGTFTYATTSTDTNIYRYGNAVQSSAKVGPDAPATPATAIDWTTAAGVAWTASK